MKDTNNLRQELMEAPSLDQFLSEIRTASTGTAFANY